ncbi:MAG TPA: cation:proton antiporter [Methylomirabilota bacterium]
MTDPLVFRDLAYVFAAAVLGGGLAWLARQPLILGYVLGGILVSPLTPGPSLSDLHTFELFAEIGVVLLMFSIGLEFSLRDLLQVRRVALLGAPLGIVASIGLGLASGWALGWPRAQGLVVGILISVASTMVMARLLIDRGELHTRHGRVMIGITLVEDLAVVILIVLLPALGGPGAEGLGTVGLALLRAAAILVPFWLLASRVMPRALTWVAGTRSPELFLLVVLAIAIGTAALTQAAGLSLALGAFLAGLLVSESDYAHETLARVLSLRDAFVALFFATLGALIDPRLVLSNLPLLAVMIGLVLVGKLVLWTGVVALFGYPLWTALLVGVGLTQIGEFSFILVQAARAASLVGDDVYNATLATALVTILANAALVRLVPRWLGRAPVDRTLGQADGPRGERAQVVLGGFGRVGSAVGEALETFGVRYVAVETDPDAVRALRSRGVPCLYGDAAHSELLEAAGVGQAALVVMTLPDAHHARLAVARARAINPHVPILARAHERQVGESLRADGATVVVEPELEAAATFIRHALHHLALPDERLAAYLDRFREAMSAGTPVPSGPEPGLPEVRDVPLTGGPLDGVSLRDAHVRERFGVTVVAIARPDGSTVVNPSADASLRAGDRLRLFGLPAQIDALVAAAGAGRAGPPGEPE